MTSTDLKGVKVSYANLPKPRKLIGLFMNDLLNVIKP